MERIDKVLASQNLGSRKQVHKLLKEGVVFVNGIVCRKNDYKCNPHSDIITVGGKKIEYKKHLYLIMNKPQDVISASNDKNAKTVLDLLPKELSRKTLFPAGRLDKDTEGLLIITDDGDFAHKMLSPGKKVFKTYYAQLDNDADETLVKKFEQGIVFRDGTKCLPAYLKITDQKNKVYLSICEGRFHQVKNMFKTCSLNVEYLKRVSIGELKLDENLAKGQVRELSENEKQLIFFVDKH